MSCGGAGGACGGGGGGNGPVRKVKVVKNEHGGEKWVIVENHRTIDENVTQPDPNRQALFGVPTVGRLVVSVIHMVMNYPTKSSRLLYVP